MATRAVPLLLCLVLAAGCGASEAEREAQQRAVASRVRVAPDGAILLSPDERRALGLVTSVAARGDVAGGQTAYGVVAASPGAEVEVGAPMTATVAGAPLVVLGQRVAAGEPLLRLTPSLDTADRATLAMRRQELGGQVDELEQRVAQQDAAAARARRLHDDGIVSLADLEAAEADAGAARARLAAARHQLSTLAARTVEALTVRAPAAGTVAALDAEAGATVHQGQRLATVLAAGGRRVDVGLPPGSPPATSFAVEVGSRWVTAQRIGDSGVIGADGLRHLWLEIPPPDGAKPDRAVAANPAVTIEPGATVLVRVGHSRDAGAVVLPAGALVPTADGDVVFVAEAPGRYRLRRVEVGERGGGGVALAGGVEAGESVVVRGAMELWGEVVKAGASAEGTADARPR